MDLTQIRVGFPVLRLEARVYHSTPRSPTAFERILLKLCNRFGDDTTYNNISLERIFVDVLGVVDPADILQQTLQELITLDVLRCQLDLSSIAHLGLRDFEITERGHQMLADDMLPARPLEDVETFFYDPVWNRLLSATETKLLRPQAPTVSIDAAVFEDVFPEEQIRSEVLRGEFSWWNPASRIERIKHQTTTILWRETPGHIELVRTTIRIVVPRDIEKTDYINSLDGDDIYQRIFVPTLGGGELFEKYAPLFPLSEKNDLESDGMEWMPVQKALDEFPNRAQVWLVDSALDLVPVPEEAGPHKAIICYDESLNSDSVGVKWNKSNDGCIVIIGGVFPFSDTVFASEGYRIQACRVRVKFGRGHYEIPLARCITVSGGNKDVFDALKAVTSLLVVQDIEDNAMVPALWLSELDFWQSHLEYFIAESDTLVEKLRRLQESRKRYITLTGKMNSTTWDEVVSRVIETNLLSREGEIPSKELDSLMAEIEQCKLTSPQVIEALSRIVIDRVQLPLDLVEFGRITDKIKKGGSFWQVEYPSRLYTQNILLAIARDFDRPELVRCLSNSNEFDQTVRQIHEGVNALTKAIAGTGLDGLRNEDSYIALLKSHNTDRIAELAATWINQYVAFCEKFQEIRPHLANSALSMAAERVAGISAMMNKLIGGIDPRFHAVIVLDTSALLARPNLLKSVRPDEFIVVSKRVLEELDDHKRDEALRPQVAQATRALSDFPKAQIQFCEGDLSLLPPDYRMKGDNLILSVAVKYRRHRPVLLTNDINLALKARSEGFEAMTIEEYDRLRHIKNSTTTANKQFSRSHNLIPDIKNQPRKPGDKHE